MWSNLFTYKEGVIYWKSRPRSDFSTDRSWRATNSNFSGKQAGTKVISKNSTTSYMQAEVNGVAVKCHRIIWEMHNGAIPKGKMIDHINGCGTDNRIENLRVVCSSESAKNKPLQKTNKSGFHGVNWHISAKKWQARINSNGVRIDLGRFDCLDDAVKARLDAEKLYGYHDNHGRPSK